LALAPDGAPVVAWADNSAGDFEIYVRRWNGSTWVELGGSASGGGISQNAGHSEEPSLAIDLDGQPVVAWSDRTTGRNEIYVLRWNGSAWVEKGAGSASGIGLSLNGGESLIPSLAIPPDGAAFVAWSGTGGIVQHIYGVRWDGSAWMELGGSASGSGISNTNNHSGYPTVTITSDGVPVVAWVDNLSDQEGNYTIFVRRWNAGAWMEIGVRSASGDGIGDGGGGQNPSAAIGPDGRPIIAWQGDEYGEPEIYILRGTLVPWGASFAPFVAWSN
jgi:hypothetical protein